MSVDLSQRLDWRFFVRVTVEVRYKLQTNKQLIGGGKKKKHKEKNRDEYFQLYIKALHPGVANFQLKRKLV